MESDISSENESGGESSSSDSEDEPASTGSTLKELPEFDKEKLSVCKVGTDSYNILYNNDSELYLMSGQYLGNIQTFDSKFCSSILVKKGELLESVREQAEKKLGNKIKLSFFGKNDSSCASFFPQASRNLENEKCLNIQNCGVPELIPIDELKDKCGLFTVMLKSGKITKKQKREFTWKMTIVEGKIEPIPKDADGYFRKLEKPKISFF